MSQLDLFAAAPIPDIAGYLDGLNPEQQAAVTMPARSAVQVLAGAGTGKTELISRRFVKLVRELRAQGIATPEERILVVTFTTDAAAAMRERIHRRLIEAGEAGLSPQAWIGTFHQVANRLLRAHPLEVGLPPDFTVLNSLEQQVLFNRVVQGILAGEAADVSEALAAAGLQEAVPSDRLSPEALTTIGVESLEALLDPDRLYRLINRIKTAGLTPAAFRHLARTQSARFTQALRTMPCPHDRNRDAIDNICLKLQSWRQHLAGWAHADWDPVQEGEQLAERRNKNLTAGCYKDANEALCTTYLMPRTFEPRTLDADFLAVDDRLEQVLTDVVAAVYALYQQALRQQGACDFDDLINHAITLLSGHPPLGARYRQLFEAMIVDEFQDSNGSQLKLLEQLRRDPPNLTVVGDIKQSIYAFRFAQPENLDLIFKDTACERIRLQTNYRSVPPVLTVANALTVRIADTAQQLHACDSHASCHAPPVTWLTLDRLFDTGSVNKDGTPRQAPAPMWEQQDKEARFIAVEIARLITMEQARYQDMAVLVRSHRKAEVIQRILAEYGIPAIRAKNLGFFQEPVIKDAMALLRLMRHLGDDRAMVRVLQGKLNHRHLRDLAQLKKTLESPSLFDVCWQLGQNPALQPLFPQALTEALADLARQLLALKKQQVRLTPVQLFQRLAQSVGIIHPATPEWQKKQQRVSLRTLEKMLCLFSQTRPLAPTLDEVIEILERYQNNSHEELPVSDSLDGEDAVRIMTVFAAKGLEFPVVFAAYADSDQGTRPDDSLLLFDPQYPGKEGFGLMLGRNSGEATLKKAVYQAIWQKPRNRTEAQRVFYVAITRAQERLYVIRCAQSADWTAPEHFPASAMTLLQESRQGDTLAADYWERDPAAIRAQLEAG